MKFYGKNGTEYDSYQAALDAGETTISTIKPAAQTAQANIPTYGYELQQLMKQYGVNSPVAPKTSDQSLIDQYFNKVSTPMYNQPTGNSLYNTYLGMGLGQLPNLGGTMANFYSGQAVAPAGFRYDPVTNTNVSVTDPGGVASAGRITTGTPNIGGNQCPPGFNFDPVSRSCVPTAETGLLTGGQSQSAQQPMPNCPPNTTLDPVNRICVPKSMQTPCPPGFTRDATGVCLPAQSQGACPNGYVRNNAGQCVPDPEQEAFFRKHFNSADAGEYDIYNAMRQGSLSENLVRELAGSNVVDQWLAKNVDPDKSFSKYAIQNLAAQGDVDDPNEANRGSQRGANRVFDLYQQGAMGLGEIEEAMGEQAVQDWMRSNQPAEYNRVYGNQQPVRNVQPANAVFDTAAEQQNMAVYNQAKASGMNAQQISAQYGIPESEISDWLNVRGLKLAKGGAVRFEDVAGKYQVGGMPTQPPMALPDDELEQMAMRYQSPAQERYDTATQSLRKTIEDMAQRGEAPRGPSKAEMYFRLASAFTAPTKTGSFFENLGLAGQEMAGVASEQRAAESAASQQRRDLALELGKFDVDTAAQMLRSEQDIAARERTFDLQEQRENRYQQTADAAAQRGREMNSTEARLLDAATTKLNAARKTAGLITQALELNPVSYSGSFADMFRRVASGYVNENDPKLIAFNEIRNLLGRTAVESLKATFGGAISDGERMALDNLQGLDAKSLEERERIMLISLNEMLNSISDSEQQIERVRSGYYRTRPDDTGSIGVPEATTEIVEEALP
jgi:hypothetical protein